MQAPNKAKKSCVSENDEILKDKSVQKQDHVHVHMSVDR